jgi:serine protease
VIVRFKPGVSEARIQAIITAEGARLLKKGRFIEYCLFEVAPGMSVEDAVRRFESFDEVEFAEPNHIYRALWTPNDPGYGAQWNFDWLGALDMRMAWELTQGSSNVVVAVVDEGVAYEDYTIPSHEVGEVYSPDGRYHVAPDLAGTQFVPGYDCVNNEPHANDEGGHGTHVSGTIAQTTNNNLECAGMAFGCKIMPVRVLGPGGGTNDDVAEGICFAYQNGADVINMSLGGSSPSDLIHQACIDAANAGVVICAATGNEGHNGISYPAAYDECIAVGSIDYWWQRAPYSNYGNEIDIVAPGGVTEQTNYCPIYQQTYAEAGQNPPIDVSTFEVKGWQGTSMATPHVSALAAMMASRGITNAASIRSRMCNTAWDLGSPGWDPEYGYGLINPVRALGAVPEYYVYDNCQAQTFWYLGGDPNAKMAVRCTPGLSPNFALSWAQALVYDDGQQVQFRMTINPSSGGQPDLSTNIAGPVTFTTVGDNQYSYYYTWDFNNVTRNNQNDFFVVFHWVTQDIPYLGGDSTNGRNRAHYYYQGSWQPATGNNFYLRAAGMKDTLAIGIEESRSQRTAGAYPTGIINVQPQPARNAARITYTVSRQGPAELVILDASGRVLTTLKDGTVQAGRQEAVWDCCDSRGAAVPNGVYFAALRTADGSVTRRLVTVR